MGKISPRIFLSGLRSDAADIPTPRSCEFSRLEKPQHSAVPAYPKRLPHTAGRLKTRTDGAQSPGTPASWKTDPAPAGTFHVSYCTKALQPDLRGGKRLELIPAEVAPFEFHKCKARRAQRARYLIPSKCTVKVPPVVLIRAADHRRRRAAKANISLCPTELSRHPQHQPDTGGSSPCTHPHPPAEHWLSTDPHAWLGLTGVLPPLERQREQSTTCSVLCLASSRVFYAQGYAGPTSVRAHRWGGCCAGAARCGRSTAVATRWRCRPADASGAGSCQKSRSQMGCFSLKVKVSGLARPVIATQAPPHLPDEAPPSWAASLVPRASHWPPFPGQGCSAALVSSCICSPWPPAPLQNHSSTLLIYL